MKRRLECVSFPFCLFFFPPLFRPPPEFEAQSGCIQLRLLQGLVGLNEAEGKEQAGKKKIKKIIMHMYIKMEIEGKKEDGCVEVCDDSVRDDRDRQRACWFLRYQGRRGWIYRR